MQRVVLTTYAEQLFGKRYKDLTEDELRGYWRERKRAYPRRVSVEELRRVFRERSRKYRQQSHAKAARSRSARRRRYSLTDAEIAQLFEDSDGLCALCYERVAVYVDHDKETGKVRGALCNPCNSGLGGLGDNEAGLLQALEYLRTA